MRIFYSDIRVISPWGYKGKRALVEYLCMLLSPFLSILFIKCGIKPNTITLLMIVAGIVAPLVFVLPFVWLKIIASLLFLLWFTLDCSDGEVARYTKAFSKYGRELDYMAHQICHPLFILSLWYNYYDAKVGDIGMLSLTCMVLMALELFYRNLVLYKTYIFPSTIQKTTNKGIMRFVVEQLFYFPNIVVFFPVVYIFWGVISYKIFIVWSFLYSVYQIKTLLIIVKLFYTTK